MKILLHIIMPVLLITACQADQVPANQVEIETVDSVSGTETAIASSVNQLFSATVESQNTATQFAVQNPDVIATQNVENDPAEVARLWIDAVLNSDGLLIARFTCSDPQTREDVQNMTLWTSIFTSINSVGAGGIGVSIETNYDLSEVTFETINQTESQALVSIRGQVTVAVLGVFEENPIDDELSLTFEDNRWKVCNT